MLAPTAYTLSNDFSEYLKGPTISGYVSFLQNLEVELRSTNISKSE
jgi:hypothetical protein